MTTLDNSPQYDKAHYAVVDLGSNSFHLLITRLNGNTVETVNKVKRKVRLAAGLNDDNKLSQEAIERGLECLALFAEHLNTIPTQNIRIVATATLRIAKNNNEFIQAANEILPINIDLLSGIQEANTIYSGVAHTCQDRATQKRLVLDIGGASTELIIGEGFKALHATSLNLGCVSFKAHYFSDNCLTQDNFTSAIQAANNIITPIMDTFINYGWQSVVGSSGTMQALAELLCHQGQAIVITPDFLQQTKQALIDCKTIDNIHLAGLRADRAPVLASGLSILIALFNCLDIKELKLSTGALREGLLFEVLPQNISAITFTKSGN